MKKIFYLFAALIPALAFTSCDDKNDLPDVDFNVTVSGASFVNNDIYVVQGDTLRVDGVSVINNEHNKGVMIPYVNYYFDGFFVGQNPIEPYGFDIVVTDAVPVGKHSLELTAPVYAVDKEPGYAVLSYTVNVVASSDDIPATAVQNNISTAKVTENGSN